MKKSITGAVTLLAGALIAHGQGALGNISFANYYSGNIGNYVTVEHNGVAVGGLATHTGTAADTGVGSDWTVQLYGAPGLNDAIGTLVPAVIDGTTSTPVTATLAGVGAGFLGQWNSSAVADIPGVLVGQAATVAIAAWYNGNGSIPTLAAAQAGGFANGFSATGNISSMGGAPNLPSALPTLGNGTINTVGTVGLSPEPSTIALGVMGASAFLMRLRKKQ